MRKKSNCTENRMSIKLLVKLVLKQTWQKFKSESLRWNHDINHCIEIFSSLNCDIQIDVKTLEKCKHCLLVYFLSIFLIDTSRHSNSKVLFDRERFISHVCWKVEFISFAITSKQIVVFAQLRQMQSQKQLWFHTNAHYVIFQYDDFICFQIDQIRNIWINICSRKSFASIFDFAFDFIYLFFFSIFKNLSLNFCLQTLSRAFRHLLIYQLNHVNCFKSWELKDIHKSTFVDDQTFRSLSFYFERILISVRKSHYFEEINMMFVCLFYSLFSLY